MLRLRFRLFVHTSPRLNYQHAIVRETIILAWSCYEETVLQRANFRINPLTSSFAGHRKMIQTPVYEDFLRPSQRLCFS